MNKLLAALGALFLMGLTVRAEDVPDLQMPRQVQMEDPPHDAQALSGPAPAAMESSAACHGHCASCCADHPHGGCLKQILCWLTHVPIKCPDKRACCKLRPLIYLPPLYPHFMDRCGGVNPGMIHDPSAAGLRY